jgi:ArsR family transcriptional regulator
VGKDALSPEMLSLVAERFKVLAEPARLQMLQVLRAGEKSVGDVVEATGLGQANVSKHLQLLLAHGYVTRRKEGLFCYYAIADRRVFELCDIMCGQLAEQVAQKRRVVARR